MAYAESGANRSARNKWPHRGQQRQAQEADRRKSEIQREDEFKAWLGQQSNNGKIRELTGGGLKVTA